MPVPRIHEERDRAFRLNLFCAVTRAKKDNAPIPCAFWRPLGAPQMGKTQGQIRPAYLTRHRTIEPGRCCYYGESMKKALVLAGLCLVLSPAAFAFDLSFGGGFLFNANLGFWHLNNRKAAQNTTFNYGLFGFFDAYYALAEVSFFGWSETIDQKDR